MLSKERPEAGPERNEMTDSQDAKRDTGTRLRMRDEQGTGRWRVPLRGHLRDRGVAVETNGYHRRLSPWVSLGFSRL